MTWEEFFANQEVQNNNARAVMLQPFEHTDREKGRRIRLTPIGNAIVELQVDDYVCTFDQKTGVFKGSRRT